MWDPDAIPHPHRWPDRPARKHPRLPCQHQKHNNHFVVLLVSALALVLGLNTPRREPRDVFASMATCEDEPQWSFIEDAALPADSASGSCPASHGREQILRGRRDAEVDRMLTCHMSLPHGDDSRHIPVILPTTQTSTLLVPLGGYV